jgi:hypothetical protein
MPQISAEEAKRVKPPMGDSGHTARDHHGLRDHGVVAVAARKRMHRGAATSPESDLLNHRRYALVNSNTRRGS